MTPVWAFESLSTSSWVLKLKWYLLMVAGVGLNFLVNVCQYHMQSARIQMQLSTPFPLFVKGQEEFVDPASSAVRKFCPSTFCNHLWIDCQVA
jgi:hypothetical protein